MESNRPKRLKLGRSPEIDTKGVRSWLGTCAGKSQASLAKEMSPGARSRPQKPWKIHGVSWRGYQGPLWAPCT